MDDIRNPQHPEPDAEQPDTEEYTQVYEVPPAGAASEAPGVAGAFRWALTVDRGPTAGLSYVLAEGITSVGRDPTNGIFLGDITVSRHHARLIVEEDGLSIEDVGSTNGTYVNGRRADEAVLVEGDEVIIGKFHLRVARGDA